MRDFIKNFEKFLSAIDLNAEYAESMLICDGDKAKQYVSYWESNGISEQRGTMLYLISKSKPYSDVAREIIPVGEWVVKVYTEFADTFTKLGIM